MSVYVVASPKQRRACNIWAADVDSEVLRGEQACYLLARVIFYLLRKSLDNKI
jgi:hypothetical protein